MRQCLACRGGLGRWNLPTDYAYTGQEEDGAGLLYYGARYYDPRTGQFLSPDTIVPDPDNLQDYNRYMYVRGNPLKYNDPSGHCLSLPSAVWCMNQLGPVLQQWGARIVDAANKIGPTVANWADKAPALWNGETSWLSSTGSGGQVGPQSLPQQGTNTAGPGGQDPNDPWKKYQMQTSGSVNETKLDLVRNGEKVSAKVDGIEGGYLKESKYLDPNSRFYSTDVGAGRTGLDLHVSGWGDQLERLSLAAQQNGYLGVRVYSNNNEALVKAQQLFGNQEWFKFIELIHESPK